MLPSKLYSYQNHREPASYFSAGVAPPFCIIKLAEAPKPKKLKIGLLFDMLARSLTLLA